MPGFPPLPPQVRSVTLLGRIIPACFRAVLAFWKRSPPTPFRGLTNLTMVIWLVVSNIFYFHPYLGEWSNLTNIFQLGWNHQLAINHLLPSPGNMLQVCPSFCHLSARNIEAVPPIPVMMMMSHPGVVLNTIGVVATFSPPTAAKLVGLLSGFFERCRRCCGFGAEDVWGGEGTGGSCVLLVLWFCFFQNEWKRELYGCLVFFLLRMKGHGVH